MHGKDNVILVDYKPETEWKFLSGMKEKTRKDWKVIHYVSNKDRGSVLFDLRRYVKYFTFTFRIFLHRKEFSNIIAWQQFYGLIYAFYCRLFHCRKVNKLVVMTFIYKDKAGPIGSVYRRFIRYILRSNYIDKIICFSSSECTYYASLFHINEDKFRFIPLGEELSAPNPEGTAKVYREKDYILAVGYSCRDYDFLIETLKNKKYQVRIYADKNDSSAGKNIKMYKSVSHHNLIDLFSNCRCIAIPLKNTVIAAGQLSMLHAMQLGKPVIVTDSKGAGDYIIHGENGFIAPNKKQIWLEYIDRIYNDEGLYQSMCRNAFKRYHAYHSLEAMGRNIGDMVISI